MLGRDESARFALPIYNHGGLSAINFIVTHLDRKNKGDNAIPSITTIHIVTHPKTRIKHEIVPTAPKQ